MARDISRVLIETVVRKMLREAKDSPERSIRNLVDMALYFSDGRIQRNFFTVAQEMLRNERSAYYPLLRDVLANVDEDRLLDFGMVMGYQGFVRGSKAIRAAGAEDIAGGEVYSRAENCHAPLTLLLPEAACPEEAQRKVYGSVVSERQRQAYRTIPWEAVRDGELVDGVLSGGPCAVTLDSQGALAGTEESAFTLGLPALLKRNFPRSTVKK